MLPNQPTAHLLLGSAPVRRAALVVVAELAVTVVAWLALWIFDLHESPLPALLAAWGACFVLYTDPVQDWLASRTGGHSLSLVLMATAVWAAMTTTELPSIYPVVVGALAMEAAQRDSSTRTALLGLALMFTGTGAAQLAVHRDWISSIVDPVPSDHLAVVLLSVGGVVLVRGVAVARASASTRAALAQEQRLRHSELQHAVTHDSLTGLLSRPGIEPELTAACASARPGHGVALMFLDLDGFKAVNDSHGHAVGDELLAASAARFREALAGRGAALARMGGDEFVAVLRDLPSAAVAGQWAQRLQASLNQPFRLSAHEDVELAVRVGVSLGLAWSETPIEVDALMRDADLAMYRDKRLRKGERRRVYRPESGDGTGRASVPIGGFRLP